MRRKYVSRINPQEAPVVAKLPPMLQERCTVAPGLLAQVIVSKYVDHLPLYRQEQIYWTRHRVWLPRQNLASWMGMATNWQIKDLTPEAWASEHQSTAIPLAA